MVKAVEGTIDLLDKLAILSVFPMIRVADIFEIIILIVLIYYCIKHLRGTRAWLLIKGVIIALGIYFIAYLTQLTVIVTIFESALVFLGIAAIVAIQPELRKFIETIGTKSINQSFYSIIRGIFKDKKNGYELKSRISDTTIQELVKGCFAMGKVKTGALICLEGDIPLKEYEESGIDIGASITSALLINIFEKNTPLHDGAVVIRDDKITAATCYLPLSDNNKINKKLGTRHRAAIGLSEVTDALVVCVSEETGAVSVAVNGVIKHDLTREKVVEELKKFQNSQMVKREKRMNHTIKNNFPIKIGSIVIAIGLWAVVTNTNNPIITTTLRDIPVQVVNEYAISDMAKTFEVVSGDTVDVEITGRRDEIDRISKSDIRLTADCFKLSFVNAVPIECYIPLYPDVKVELSESTLQIAIEDYISTEVHVTIENTGKANPVYYVSSIDLSTDTLIIYGGKSIVNSIGSAVVEIDQSTLIGPTTLKLYPKIYDKNGEEIESDKISLNYDYIEADIELYNVKRIPLNIETTVNNPVLASIVEEVNCPTMEIYITGPDELLSTIDSLDIEVPIDMALSDITKTEFVKNIPIQSYLPDGIMVTNQNSVVSVVVTFTDFYTNNVIIDSSDIRLSGVGKGLTATIEDAEYTAQIVSKDSKIEGMTIEDLRPYIDLNKLSVGEYMVDIRFMAPVSVFDSLHAKVIISEAR